MYACLRTTSSIHGAIATITYSIPVKCRGEPGTLSPLGSAVGGNSGVPCYGLAAENLDKLSTFTHASFVEPDFQTCCVRVPGILGDPDPSRVIPATVFDPRSQDPRCQEYMFGLLAWNPEAIHGDPMGIPWDTNLSPLSPLRSDMDSCSCCFRKANVPGRTTW